MKKKYFLSLAVLISLFLSLFSSPLLAGEENSTSSMNHETIAPPEQATLSSDMENTQTEASEEPLFDEKEALLHYKEGINWYKKRSYQKAISELEKAIEINPDYKEAYYLLGYAYYKEGKMDLSREAFNQAYALDPKYSPELPK